MKYQTRLCLLLSAWVVGSALLVPARAAAPVTLAGSWRFALDRNDVGVNEQWFSRDLPDRITLPGALQAQGYGNDIGTDTPWVLSLYDRQWFLRADYQDYVKPGAVKVPFLAQPPKHYLGAAWYQRDCDVPAAWQGRRVVLTLERPHWETTVWLDGRKVGTQNSLVAPHEYDLGALTPGRHRLSVRVDNRLLMPYRPDAHSVSDSLGGSWNGIVGNIALTATTPVWIADAQVFPRVADKSALIKVTLGNMTGRSGAGTLSAGGASVPVQWDAAGGTAEMTVALGPNAQLWDEFNPVLQHLTLQLTGPDADDSRALTFGLREFGTRGNEFVINGRLTHLRGTHHGGDFPLTGYPPTDVAYWRKIFRINRAWGMNHIRFHSFCPPEAAFVAADEMGFYLQPEAGMWNQISPGTPMEKMMYDETERMLRAYGNHPSFVLLSPSNEPGARWKESLPGWVKHFHQSDPRRLYTTGTGWSLIDTPGPVEGADYLAVHRIGQNMLRGNSAWFGRDYRKSLTGVNVPVASHELGQWVAYPDYAVIKKFTGYLRPGNYEIFRDSLAAHGLLAKNQDFALASGRYQLAAYKEEVEANLRTPGLGGFQLLDLHDYLGQGTALVGLLDAFWEEKGYVSAAEWRRFCNTTVPLARLLKRTFTTAEPFTVETEIAHYGAAPLTDARPYWRVTDDRGQTVAQGALPARTVPLGKNTPLGPISLDLARLPAPRAYKLILGLAGTPFENDWNFWVYPAHTDSDFLVSSTETANAKPSDVLVTNDWAEAEQRLNAGGKVIFTPNNADLAWDSPPLDTVPVFWNRLMGPGWGRMLGLWSDVKHPALAGFPTQAHADWQWMELMRGTRAVNLDRLPRALTPIVYAIDDWNRNYKLALLFECKVGRGRLLVSSVNLVDKVDSPVARQWQQSLLDYAGSNRFQPSVAVAAADLRGLLFDTRIMRELGATAQAADGEADKAIDGDPNTFWLTGAKRKTRQPDDLTVTFANPAAMSGLILMPRQNHREHEGDIREYVVQTSDDGQNWRETVRGTLLSTFAPQQIRFPQTVTARYLKLTALSGFGPDPATSLADLAVIYVGPPLPGMRRGIIEYQRSKSATPDIDEGPGDAPKPKPTPTPRKPER